ncbi:hypothetical protein J6590_011519 [Homalodisca vitripennis]|nr:hypothetical protein J6590_011519 [Homalodisca vitripennis]
MSDKISTLKTKAVMSCDKSNPLKGTNRLGGDPNKTGAFRPYCSDLLRLKGPSPFKSQAFNCRSLRNRSCHVCYWACKINLPTGDDLAGREVGGRRPTDFPSSPS